MDEEDFHKQRRNLILISFVVIFYNITGSHLTKLNVLGNEIVITNLNIMPGLLSIILFYVLLRYCQYLHLIKDKGFRTTLIEATQKSIATWLFNKYVKSKHERYFETLKHGYEFFRPFAIVRKTRPWEISTLLRVFYGDYKTDSGNFDVDLKLTRAMYCICKADAYLYLVLRTHLITEYVFPLMLAFAAALSFIHVVAQTISTNLSNLSHYI